ncbi:MAG: hypothetical protein WAK92_02825, partial [Thiobacillus sp.]
ELGPALDAAFASTVPCVVNVLVDRAAGAAIKVDPRAALIMFDDLASGQRIQQGLEREPT